VLTLRTRPGVRKQSVRGQVRRYASDTLVVVDVKPGQGA
jgi:hypothetical protein